MKKILIIGQNSYIGNSFASFAGTEYDITKISSRNGVWKDISFSEFDCILFCAGIAHQKASLKLHFDVNFKLTTTIAKKAKEENVKHFIYISSAAVFGRNQKFINTKTKPNPDTNYGRSKLAAENEIKKLQDKDFLVTIVRPPMVYGKNCKGNFQKLVKLCAYISIFPDIKNQRSMIYIDNLNYFLSHLIQYKIEGEFYPQNREYACTSELVKLICKYTNKKIWFVTIYNTIILFFSKHIIQLDKLFGNCIYEGTEIENIEYVSFNDSIFRSV